MRYHINGSLTGSMWAMGNPDMSVHMVSHLIHISTSPQNGKKAAKWFALRDEDMLPLSMDCQLHSKKGSITSATSLKHEAHDMKRLGQEVTLKRAWALSDSNVRLIQPSSGGFTIERSRFFLLQAGSIHPPPTWAQKWKHWSKYGGGEEMVAMDLWSWRGKRSMHAGAKKSQKKH